MERLPSFRDGVLSAFDLATGGFYPDFPPADKRSESIVKTLRVDWEAIGQDLLAAIRTWEDDNA